MIGRTLLGRSSPAYRRTTRGAIYGPGRYRCRDALPLIEASRSADGTKIVEYHEDACVRRFPPRVDWSLLAICQTILALPLVLLWTVLRWRRMRRTRLANSRAC